jgi:hypothetical protein
MICKTDRIGTKRWYTNDKLHRDDGPAVEYLDGTCAWVHNGEFHRTDGPALEYAAGDKHWYQHGEKHRTDGPAAEYTTTGNVEWWVAGTYILAAEFAAEFLDKDTALLWKMSGYCWPFNLGLGK